MERRWLDGSCRWLDGSCRRAHGRLHRWRDFRRLRWRRSWHVRRHLHVHLRHHLLHHHLLHHLLLHLFSPLIVSSAVRPRKPVHLLWLHWIWMIHVRVCSWQVRPSSRGHEWMQWHHRTWQCVVHRRHHCGGRAGSRHRGVTHMNKAWRWRRRRQALLCPLLGGRNHTRTHPPAPVVGLDRRRCR